jgi:hypothetical protein
MYILGPAATLTGRIAAMKGARGRSGRKRDARTNYDADRANHGAQKRGSQREARTHSDAGGTSRGGKRGYGPKWEQNTRTNYDADRFDDARTNTRASSDSDRANCGDKRSQGRRRALAAEPTATDHWREERKPRASLAHYLKLSRPCVIMRQWIKDGRALGRGANR